MRIICCKAFPYPQPPWMSLFAPLTRVLSLLQVERASLERDMEVHFFLTSNCPPRHAFYPTSHSPGFLASLRSLTSAHRVSPPFILPSPSAPLFPQSLDSIPFRTTASSTLMTSQFLHQCPRLTVAVTRRNTANIFSAHFSFSQPPLLFAHPVSYTSSPVCFLSYLYSPQELYPFEYRFIIYSVRD